MADVRPYPRGPIDRADTRRNRSARAAGSGGVASGVAAPRVGLADHGGRGGHGKSAGQHQRCAASSLSRVRVCECLADTRWRKRRRGRCRRCHRARWTRWQCAGRRARKTFPIEQARKRARSQCCGVRNKATVTQRLLRRAALTSRPRHRRTRPRQAAATGRRPARDRTRPYVERVWRCRVAQR